MTVEGNESGAGLNLTPLMAIALGRHEMFQAYVEAGFSDAQAMNMIMGEIALDKSLEHSWKEERERKEREG
jgi:hypothetical protein